MSIVSWETASERLKSLHAEFTIIVQIERERRGENGVAETDDSTVAAAAADEDEVVMIRVMMMIQRRVVKLVIKSQRVRRRFRRAPR